MYFPSFLYDPRRIGFLLRTRSVSTEEIAIVQNLFEWKAGHHHAGDQDDANGLVDSPACPGAESDRK
ncbi:MAG: hypothetical protein IPF59_14345 [Ignavibacteria bacterium]|nr:hypothetical protein [Ignavibacteria bacterium]